MKNDKQHTMDRCFGFILKRVLCVRDCSGYPAAIGTHFGAKGRGVEAKSPTLVGTP